MPTTFIGLILSVAFLTPGFLYTSQRRLRAPHGDRSALMETTSIVTISLVTNTAALAAFGTLRAAVPDHTPEPRAALDYGSGYWLDHLPYLLAWTTALLGASCVLALTAASSQRVQGAIAQVTRPVIRESSALHETFDAEPGSYVHVGLDLTDGSYIAGRLIWFSTAVDETDERDLVLGPPLQHRYAGDDDVNEPQAERVIIAAGRIGRIYMTPIREQPAHPPNSAASAGATH